MFRRTAFTRLFVIFLVCLLVLEGALFALIAWSRSSVQHELNQSTANSLRYLSQQFDDDIANLQYEMQCATQSRFITHLFAYYQTMKPSERYTELNDALTYLENLSTYNRNIDRLELYSYQHDFRLGVGKAPAVTYLSRDEMRSLLAEFREGGFRLLSSLEGELTVNYMVPISSYVTDREPTFYLRVSFGRTRVLESLQSLATDGNAAMAYLIYLPEKVVYATPAAPDHAAALMSMAFTGEVGFLATKVDGRKYVAVGKLLDENPDCLLVQLIDAQKLYAFPNRLQNLMVLFTACGFVALAFYMLSVRRTVARPINDLLWAFDRISEGRLQTRLEPSYTDEFDRLSRHFNRMTAQLAGLIEKDYKQTILLQDAKMKHLQAQINPHFLYNSFYLLSHLVKMEDQEAAEKLSRYLGDYFRYITDQSRNVLPLQEEYDHAVIYLSIQLMRFGHRVCAEIEPVPKAFASLAVPRLILQPLLENVLEHGIEADDQVRVKLSFHWEAPYLRIWVEDSGSALADQTISRLNAQCESEETPAGHALSNIHRRLAIHYGDPVCGLSFSRSPLGGLRVCLTVKQREGA